MDALFARILEDPADLAARAVYADALTEAGDPRGEFIAAQCVLAAAGVDRVEDLLDVEVDAVELARLAAIQRRVQQLLAQHGARWEAELALPPGVSVGWRRGFPEAVDVSHGSDAAAAIAHLAPRTPIGELALGAHVRKMPALRHPHYLRALEITDAVPIGTLEKAMKRALRRLRIAGNRFDDTALAALGDLPALRELALVGNDRVTPKALARTAAAIPQLVLRLPECNFSDKKLGALLAATPTLRGLDLHHNPASVAMLAKLVALPALRHLGYAPTLDIDTLGAARTIARATAPLRWLALGIAVSATSLTALARAPVGAGLRGLVITSTSPVDTGGLAAFPSLVMLEAPAWAAEVGVAAIAERPLLAHFDCESVDDRAAYRRLRAHFGACVSRSSTASPIRESGTAKQRILVRCSEDDVSEALAARTIPKLHVSKVPLPRWDITQIDSDLDPLGITHDPRGITVWWWRDEADAWAPQRDALIAHLTAALS